MVDPGATTGTRDEHYDLTSVLYHALHGAEAMEEYILDAEAAGDEQLVSFFREAQAMQAQTAERARELLGILEVPPAPEVAPDLPPEGGISPARISGGIPPEIPEEVPPDGGISPDTISGGVPPRPDDLQREADTP